MRYVCNRSSSGLPAARPCWCCGSWAIRTPPRTRADCNYEAGKVGAPRAELPASTEFFRPHRRGDAKALATGLMTRRPRTIAPACEPSRSPARSTRRASRCSATCPTSRTTPSSPTTTCTTSGSSGFSPRAWERPRATGSTSRSASSGETRRSPGLESPHLLVLEGRTGRIGRTRTRAEYRLTPADHGMTRVEYRFETEPGTPFDRLKESLGPARLAAPGRPPGAGPAGACARGGPALRARRQTGGWMNIGASPPKVM